MTDNINPEYQHPPKEENMKPAAAPAPMAEKKGNGLALLAVLIGLVGAGLGGYNFQQAKKHGYDYADGQENPRFAELEVAIQQQAQAQKNFASTAALTQLTDKVNALSNQPHEAGIDKAELEKMISSAIAASQLTPEQVAQMAPAGVSTEEVQSMINQAVAKMGEGEHQIDLSKEIAAIQASENSAKQAADNALAVVKQLESEKAAALEVVETKAKDLSAGLEQKLTTLQQSMGDIDLSAIGSAPLLNALKLAQMAASNGNYAGASHYLAQANETFTLFGLAQSDYGQYQGAVSDLRVQYGTLASQPSPAAKVNAIIADLGNWSFKNANPVEKLAAEADSGAESVTWVDTLKGVGKNILDNTVSITPIDDAGLVWLNADETLQNVLRENVRLDLAFARNALQLGSQAEYAKTVDTLQTEIERYFDTSNASVAAALQTLTALKAEQTHGADIAALVQRIEQTK